MLLTGYLLYWVNTGFDFDKMQIPCKGHVCFLFNNICCCDRHIHAHNHRFSPRAPISKNFKVPGIPATTFRGFLNSFKWSSLIQNGSYAEIFGFA